MNRNHLQEKHRGYKYDETGEFVLRRVGTERANVLNVTDTI
jgi:hypothetical protein